MRPRSKLTTSGQRALSEANVHGIFRAVGYPVDAPPTPLPPSIEILNVALVAFDKSPEARTAEAAIAAMLYALLRLEDPKPDETASERSLRRAGYASERLLNEDLTLTCRLRVERWVGRLKALCPQASECAPLAWSKHSTPKRMARLQKEADEINERWQVYGTARLRLDVLSRILEATDVL